MDKQFVSIASQFAAAMIFNLGIQTPLSAVPAGLLPAGHTQSMPQQPCRAERTFGGATCSRWSFSHNLHGVPLGEAQDESFSLGVRRFRALKIGRPRWCPEFILPKPVPLMQSRRTECATTFRGVLLLCHRFCSAFIRCLTEYLLTVSVNNRLFRKSTMRCQVNHSTQPCDL
jgi:hypothetical protein